jgi:glucokinase
MLNDLEASAYGMALLEDNDLEAIYTSGHLEKGNVAILAPETDWEKPDISLTENT